MKKRICAVLITAAAVLALTACGSDDEKKSGTTEVKTTVTTAPASTSTDPASTSTEPASTSTDPKTPDSTSTSTEPETTEPAASGSFSADSLKVVYKGVEIKLGDKVSDLKDSLGAESAPVSEGEDCLSGAKTRFYNYAGMQLTANQDDVILKINLANFEYPGDEVATAGGLKIGDAYDRIKAEKKTYCKT